MRLIDADDLIITILTHDLCDTEQIDKDILEAPTVEAIPIELIYKIRNLYLKNDCIISAGVCNEILNMWKAENEQNKENASQTD